MNRVPLDLKSSTLLNELKRNASSGTCKPQTITNWINLLYYIMYRYDQSQQGWFMEAENLHWRHYWRGVTANFQLRFVQHIPYHLWNFEDGKFHSYQLHCVAWNFFSANMNTLIQLGLTYNDLVSFMWTTIASILGGSKIKSIYLPDFVTYVVYITDGRNINN